MRARVETNGLQMEQFTRDAYSKVIVTMTLL